MIQSMTGFGRAAGALSARYFATVTTKSVNHRYLEATVRLPEYMWDMEAPLRAVASEFFSRGKVDLSVRIQRTQQPEYTVRINTQIANVVIPMPFSKGVIVYGAPMAVPRDGEIEEWRLKLERTLDELSEEAERLVSKE